MWNTLKAEMTSYNVPKAWEAWTSQSLFANSRILFVGRGAFCVGICAQSVSCVVATISICTIVLAQLASTCEAHSLKLSAPWKTCVVRCPVHQILTTLSFMVLERYLRFIATWDRICNNHLKEYFSFNVSCPYCYLDMKIRILRSTILKNG